MSTAPDPAAFAAAVPPEASLRLRLEEAEAQLRALTTRLARMRAALHALPDGVVVVDIAGHITDINLGAVHLTGWPEAEALGKPLHEVVRLLDAQGRRVDLLSAHSRGGVEVSSLVRRDWHPVLVEATFASILDHDRHLAGWVVSFRNVTAAKRISDELTWQATHDPLTGVLNRRALEARLERAVANAESHRTPHALLYMDLDRFKAVNDQGGHFAGDELLRNLSALLRRTLRENETLARLGGDEFAVLLENCAHQEALVVAERIREAMEAFRFHWQDSVFDVGASIGLVSFATGALTPAELLQRADEMCYLAKAEGRNQVQACEASGRRARPGYVSGRAAAKAGRSRRH